MQRRQMFHAMWGVCGVLACDGPPRNPVAPNLLATSVRRPSMSELPLDAAPPSASGAGVLIQEPSGARRTFTFHARVMPDGSVEGKYVNHNRQLDVVNHGDVDCIRFIRSNEAVMSAVVRKSPDIPNVAQPGWTLIFRVVDNGEGDEAGDRVSGMVPFPPGSTQNCNNFTPGSTLPIIGGNVQVQPLAPDLISTLLNAPMAISEFASSGGPKASGHADVQGTPAQGVGDESYSFIAIPTDVPPRATGRVEGRFLRFTGESVTVHAEVTCASIVANQAWVGGRVTRFRVDGAADEPWVIGRPVVFRVQDLGEGHGTKDVATLLFFAAPLGLPDELAYCSTRPEFPRLLRESTNGNIQVKPE